MGGEEVRGTSEEGFWTLETFLFIMLFSIIIPIYNVEKYLCDCLESLLNQGFCDWESVCVNDGSTDGSLAVLEAFAERDARIKVINQANTGTAAARNTGMKAAKGDYIFFLDSDDWLEKNALQAIADNLNGEDVLCFSGRRYFEATNEYHSADRLPEKTYTSGMAYYNENALLPRDFAFVCVVLRVYRRAFIMENNLFFDQDVSYEDNLWVPIMLCHTQTAKVIPDVLYVYRVREGSKMQEVSLARKKDMLKVANRLAAFFIPMQGFDKTIVYRAITHHFQVVLVNAPKDERKELKRLCDWKSYETVSRTKLRHYMNYWKNKLT